MVVYVALGAVRSIELRLRPTTVILAGMAMTAIR